MGTVGVRWNNVAIHVFQFLLWLRMMMVAMMMR